MDVINIFSVDDLAEVAERIIPKLKRYRTVAFYGEMGAGKTTLIKEIAALLGVADEVTSPTFAIVNQYSTNLHETVYHFDFYRIDRIEEAYDMGYEEYFYSGDICLIEWPEKIDQLLPQDVLKVKIELNPDDQTSRTITITEPV